MKSLMITAVIGLAMTFTGFSNNTTPESNEVKKVEAPDSYFKIVNDTGDKVRIHTGYGETTLNPRGGSTSVRCTSKKKVKVDGDVIFEITSDLCGTTVKLSEYL